MAVASHTWDTCSGRLWLPGKKLGKERPAERYGGFLVAQTGKNLPAMQDIWVGSLGWEDPLEKQMATHSRILAWRIPWTEEPGRLESRGCKESANTE